MKKALFVSYAFPPMAAVGGQRVAYFCKFLPRFGWTPVVLTVKKGVNLSWDQSLLESVADTKVYRSRSFEPLLRREMRRGEKRESYKAKSTGISVPEARLNLIKRIKRVLRHLLSVPDFAIFWVPFGIISGLKAIRKEKMAVIVSSSPPVSAHIISSVLARLTGLPHVADFRDLWTLNHVYAENNYPKYVVRYDSFWERFVLKKTSWIVTASPGFSKQMENHFDGLLASRVTTITNGFDYGEVDLNKKVASNGGKRMRFIYAGSLYSHFNPVFFLECFSEWLEGHGIDNSRVKIDFYGNSDIDYESFISELGLKDIVFFHGFKPRKELLPILLEGDCLLLFLGFEKSCADVIPAKLFEYLASGARIIALTPTGVAADIITRYQAGFTLTEPDRKSMINLINRVYREWKDNVDIKRGYRYIENIDRVKLTGQLAGLLDRITSDHLEDSNGGIAA